ncbi:1-aminocyclopropane-1-carboxylate synthase-like protein 1 [Rhopilema esculentum]|uniref:1-aminocyclopropane-1-carboxylate synthase-like protein 1 n=1 Tax=Rhopilema esculentum TaxID=499914 RepID=UPI0031D10AD1
MSAESNSKRMSNRGARSVSHENVLIACLAKTIDNPFHPETNPDGIINIGTSENKLVKDILTERFSKVRHDDMPDRYMECGGKRGLPEFRQSLETFLNKYMKPAEPFEKDNLYVYNGCGSAIEMLAFAICDDGDCLLVPSPYYGTFETYVEWRMGVKIYPVDLSSEVNEAFGESGPFELSVGRLEKAYEKAKSEGFNVRGLLMSNPINPLGKIYTKSQLEGFFKFANTNNLHFILDEIYFLSVHDGTTTPGRSIVDAIDPKLLHIVWGFSKDFAISGYRCGLVHTVNEEVEKVLNANANFYGVPTPIQFLLKSIIDENDWLDSVYFPTNIKRMQAARSHVCKELTDLGISFLAPAGGFFIWVDMRNYVKPLSKEGEMKLLNAFLDNGVYICPGLAFHSKESGWFRIIFTSPDEYLLPAIQRVKYVLQNFKKNFKNQKYMNELFFNWVTKS